MLIISQLSYHFCHRDIKNGDLKVSFFKIKYEKHESQKFFEFFKMKLLIWK